MMRILVGVAAIVAASPALAQSDSPPAPFTGAYAGAEIGAHEHHMFIEVTDFATGDSDGGRYYRAWGLGGGAFAGYDLAVAPRVRVGVEAGVSVGGDNPVARFSDGTDFTQRPRYGYRVTGKAGYLLTNRLLAYGTFGYGGHRYRLSGSTFVEGANEWGSSFTIGGGLEYRLSRRAGVRLDFRHLDNQMSHILVGVPVRF